jgi:hypothetical protein
MTPEQRLATVAALAMLVTMFLPWYGLQGLDRRTGVIHPHSISAFGDVSFVEAAIFLVAVAVVAMLFARADGRAFQLPGGDGTIVMAAGCWAALLIFYRVFSRPAGDGYPVGIEWGFFLAFVAAGGLAYAGWRMRSVQRPQPPATTRSRRRPAPAPTASVEPDSRPADEQRRAPDRGSRSAAPAETPRSASGAAGPPTALRPAPAPVSERRPGGRRPRYPPTPPTVKGTGEQLSFEDPPLRSE